MSVWSRMTGDVARTVLPIVILVVGIVAFWLFGQKPTVARDDSGDNQTALVNTVEVEAYTGTFDLTIDGLTVPFREVKLAAQVSGRITKADSHAREGKTVEEQQFLLQIDPQNYQLEVDRLTNEKQQKELAVSEMETEIDNTTTLIELAERDLKLQGNEADRIERAYRQNAASARERDQAQQSVLKAQNTLKTLKNQKAIQQQKLKTTKLAVDSTQVALDRAELDKTRSEVTSPVKGIVVEGHVEQGDYVQVGQTLLTIESTEKIEIKSQLRVGELAWIWMQANTTNEKPPTPGDIEQQPATRLTGYNLPNLPVQIIYEIAGEEFYWSGTLSRFDGIGLDPKTRLAPVRIVCENPVRSRSLSEQTDAPFGPPALVRGMYVTVKIPITPKVGLVTIPQKALRPGGEVWTKRQGKLQRVKVDPVRTIGENVLVRSLPDGLVAGDEVILSPLPFVKDGLPVRTADEATANKTDSDATGKSTADNDSTEDDAADS